MLISIIYLIQAFLRLHDTVVERRLSLESHWRSTQPAKQP